MENKIEIFKNEKFGEIRVVEIDGKTYFVGCDVARALGYQRPNDAITQHCRSTAKRRMPDSQGVPHDYLIISEGDVYRIAARSELPGAEEFESWIFDEVLPAIRKTGAYVPKPLSAFEMLELTFSVMKEQKQELEEIKKEVRLLDARTRTRENYFTIVGYASLNGISVNRNQAAALGIRASRICNNRGIEMDTTPDPRFGRVKLYPSEILDEVFETSIACL
jgi:prophage antirepressor-like protein